MKNTIVVMSSNREMERQTAESLTELAKLGAIRLLESGSPDVAFSRCRALSWTCDQLREHPERDMVLMVDDDMVIAGETAQIVVEQSRRLQIPCSAAYTTVNAMLAAERLPTGLWLAGLGCLAIPRAVLLDLEQRSESFENSGVVYSAFTWCGPENGKWIAEDFRLCRRLGGVKLLPVMVGHVKKWELWPDDEAMAGIGAMSK